MNQVVSLPYNKNSSIIFSLLEKEEWSIFLDSGNPSHHSGRYDILAAEPIATVVSDKNISTVTHYKSEIAKEVTTASAFHTLRATLSSYSPSPNKKKDLPFNGGALGYLSYDLARHLEKIPSIAQDFEQFPDMAIGIYTWAIVVDHQLKKSYLTGKVVKENPKYSWKQLIETFSKNHQEKTSLKKQIFKVDSKIESNFSYSDYQIAFNKIKDYIVAGDCYQINLTQRFSASASGDPWSAYLQLRELNPAPFSAYINTPFGQILSSSPERFLKVKENIVETKPIKGTRPRSSNKKEDQRQSDILRNSPKDQAENVMIVDLLRNDLGRVCEIGSVKVPSLFDVESYTTVHHLVSKIKGKLAKNKDAIDLLEACFPGGSITGAPKVRAMEIIESIEPHRRSVYCGSIAYIDFNGNMDTNIAIRTLLYNQNTIRYWVGGGIVYDSNIDEEYQETFDKGKALMELLTHFSID